MYNKQELVVRMGAAGVRYVRIVAPAGFGKSTLVHAFAKNDAEATIADHDCREIAEAEAPARVIADWLACGAESTHVFDHLEAVAGDEGALEGIKGFLRRLAPGSRAILLSRAPLPETMFSDVAPHEILAVNHHDLQFEIADLHREFTDANLGEGSIAEIMRVTRGWPAAVLLLRRLIHCEEDTAILLDLTAPALRVFHDYVLHEVLTPLSTANMETLVACATLPHASFDDVAAALGIESANARIDELHTAFPLIGYHANATIALHPLVLATLKARYAAWIERSTARAIDTHIARGATVAAARMYLELGRLDEAAQALGSAHIDFQSTQQTFEELAAQLDDTVVCASPALWNILFPFRRYRCEPHILLLEADRLLSASFLNKTSPIEACISASKALLLCDVGEFDRALSLCTALEARACEQGVNVEAYTKMAEAIVMSHKGRFSESLALWQRAGFATSFNAFPTSRQLKLEARAARAHGQFDIETELHRRHVNLTRRSGIAAFEAMALTEAAFAAWVAGRDDLMYKHAATYRRDIPRALGYWFDGFFLSMAARPDIAFAMHGPSPRINAYSALIRSGIARKIDEKLRHAQLAKVAADACKAGFLSILSRVALSFLAPEGRAQQLRESLAIAESFESSELTAALETLMVDANAHAGMLEPLAQRHRPARAEPKPAALHVNVLHGSVMRNGAAIVLSPGTMELLVALSLERKPASRERLCPLLWPDSEPEEAGNALKMCARRLRAQLDDFGIIDWTKAGYALRADTLVDVATVFPAVDAALRHNAVKPEEMGALRSFFDALAAGRPSFMMAWEWFEPTERRLCAMAHELGVLLATNAFDREDEADCWAICGQLLAADACDETAHELHIRLRLRAGDYDTALRDLHAYRVLLKEELGVEPRAEFQRMFERSVAARGHQMVTPAP